jgi:hypothetical protein
MTTPADDGISAARRDMQKATEAENARKAARTIALASIEKLVDQLGEVAAYLDQGEFLAALGTLQGFEEETKNVLAAERLLRMAVR